MTQQSIRGSRTLKVSRVVRFLRLDMDFIIGIFYLALFMRKWNHNCDIIKYRYAAHFA